MAYLSFPCIFTEEDDIDTADNLKREPRTMIRTVRINVNQISYFTEKDKTKTEVFMSNQESFILEITPDDFEDVIAECDNFFDLPMNVN